jgi:PleD family two-component response regulator
MAIPLVQHGGSTGLMSAQVSRRSCGREEILRPKAEETMNSVLLIEDFVPFRAFVSTLLGEKPAFKIASQASDGFEAVRRARELNPDLILLELRLFREGASSI